MLNLMCFEMPLGISFFEILLHILNFCILLVGMRFLLYKPVKKAIQTRKDAVESQMAEIENQRLEAEKLKEECNMLLADANKVKEDAFESARAEAKVVADAMITKAKQDAELLRESKLNEVESELKAKKSTIESNIQHIGVTVAESILSREITKEEHNRIISDALSSWINED